MKRKPHDRLSRAPEATMLLIAGSIVVLIALFSFQDGRLRAAASDELLINRRIQELTSQLLATLTDAETGQRGYLLTGRDEYLAPYHRAVAAIPGILLKLKAAAVPRPAVAERVGALEPVVTAKLQELELAIRVRREQGLPPAEAIVESDRGKTLMDDVRAACHAIQATTESRAAQYSAAAETNASRLSLVSTFGGILLLGFLGLSAVTIFRGMERRDELYREAASSAELLRVSLASIGDAVISTDADARITFINPVAQKLTGWDEAEALGAPIQQVLRIVHEGTRADLENPLIVALAKGTVVGLANHAVLLAKGGEEIPIDDSGAPIRGERGAIVGAIVVFRDISARRQSERQLKESNEQLKQFVAAAAHDLRSPLNSVSAIAQLLNTRYTGQLGEEGNQLLGYITSGVARMSRFLEDLLAYAHASHFERDDGAPASVEMALGQALENLRAEIESSGAEVTHGRLPMVAANETHMVQLLQNLVGNALKYRSQDAPRIEVSAVRNGVQWTLQVGDNGIGIEPQFVDEIFKPFRRLHGEDRPGSGIGLATCRKIVTGYGGRIWVDSKSGRGSTFFVTLPAAAETRAARG
jgi:PAS domain S-box-containing protein